MHSEFIEDDEYEKKDRCPYDICDGSGMYTEGEFDDLVDKKCLCKIEQEQMES